MQRCKILLNLPFVTLLLLLCLVGVTISNPDAKRLYDDLLSNYNRLIRPVSNNTDTVLVKLGLRLSQLIELVGAEIWPGIFGPDLFIADLFIPYQHFRFICCYKMFIFTTYFNRLFHFMVLFLVVGQFFSFIGFILSSFSF